MAFVAVNCENCVILLLSDLVELGVHFKQIFLCELHTGHAHKPGKLQQGERAEHLHHAVVGLHVYLETGLALALALLHFLHQLAYHAHDEHLALESTHDVAELVVEKEISFGLGDIEPVENSALFSQTVILVEDPGL